MNSELTAAKISNNMKAFLVKTLQVKHVRLVYPHQAAERFFASKKNKTRPWMNRHVQDTFVRQAQDEGHVSRSYYKLQQMNDKLKLMTTSQSKIVVELGAAPGGWTSYVSKFLGADGTLIAIDVLPLHPKVVTQLSTCPCSVHVLQGDFKSLKVRKELERILANQKADLVLSDMAVNFTGDSSMDVWRPLSLVESALEVSIHALLASNGTFVAKYVSCADEVALRNYARRHFEKIKTVKPAASRKQSAERYLVATGFQPKTISNTTNDTTGI
jgi:23S rRNA (uridine2552-2'-O)-methyltransferase